jgi:Hint domain/RTX calcium-binding nonapeptide repeat (4 copies)
LFGGQGNDSLYGGDGDEGTIGGDRVSGDDGNDFLFGGTGNDSLSGGNDSDQLFGGDGNDSLAGDNGDDSLSGGTGNDTLLGGEGADSLAGGNDTDQLFGGEGADVLAGDAGADSLFGANGDDTLLGGTGNDSLFGGNGDDSLSGGNGVDSIFGGDGNDTIFGGLSDDSLFGDTGNDLFIYEDGDIASSSVTAEAVFGGSDLGDGDNDSLNIVDHVATYGWKTIVITYTSGDEEDGTIELWTGVPGASTLLGTITFEEIETLIRCFTPGTMILTDRGEVAVEDLGPGDLVMTRDNGLQPVRWVGRQQLSRSRLMAEPELQPVRIASGAIAGQGPERAMLVSPQHRVLIAGARAELLFGEDEVLVPAKHLIGIAEVTRALPEAGVTYIHILFDRHEIVQSDGIWTESFQPAERMLSEMEAEVRDEILAIFPELSADTSAYDGSRMSLKAHEAKVLFAR